MNKLMLTSVEAEFINLDLAYRYQEKWFYAGAGMFLGIPTGTWSSKNALNGNVTESLLYGDLESSARITTGLELLCGLSFNINENFSLNTGLKLLIPFIPAYKHDQDEIKILDTAICVSLSHKFSVPFID